MTRQILIAVLTVAAATTGASAFADNGYHSGHRHHSVTIHPEFTHPPRTNCSPRYPGGWSSTGCENFRPQPVWHDTTHWDYHPGTFRPHGNHVHYVPGHYHRHQTGHWDY
jgi:hypothetical protein